MLAVGMVVWLASELMFFGGLFAAWFTLRSMSDAWPPPGVDVPTATAAIATGVLVLSSLAIDQARRADERGDHAAFGRWLVLTLALGALFLASTLRDLVAADFEISTNAYGSLYYVIIGLHGVHVAAGLVLGGIVLVVTAGSTPRARRGPIVEVTTYYWHFVVVTWLCVFAIVFLLQ